MRKQAFVAVITGDVINSRKVPAGRWMPALKNELARSGVTPRHWEIYRGDSFQLEIKEPAEALTRAVLIKAALKSIKGIDTRIAIGIGLKTHTAKKITESNGSAFILSGELAEELKKRKVTLAVRSNNTDFDQEINVSLALAMAIMDHWSVNLARTVHAKLNDTESPQEVLGRKLKVKQNAVSTRLSRASYYEIEALLELFVKKVNQLP
jgi:hypothetical protein